MRVLFRAWVFTTGLLGVLLWAVREHERLAFSDVLLVTVTVSGILFALGGGLAWVLRGAGRRA